MGAALKQTFLGKQGLKEYYMREDGTLTWRVPDIREAVRVGPGRKVVAADYSQAELKIMAFLSQEPIFIKAINEGLDLHCQMTAEVSGLLYDLVYEAYSNDDHPQHDELTKKRGGIKTTTFGIPYGAGASTVARQTGMPEEDAQVLLDSYFAKVPTLKAWLDAIKKKAIADRLSRSMIGRIRHYIVPNRQDPEYRKIIGQIGRWAGNLPIQSTCADMLKRALVILYKAIRGGKWNAPRLYDIKIIIVAHDEILLDTTEELAGTTKEPGLAAKMLRDAMEESYNSMTTTVRTPDPVTGKLVERVGCLKEIRNKIDVKVGDFWIK